MGWDFSTIASRTITEGEKWDFSVLVTQRLNKSLDLLDLGTGGAERLLEFAPFVQKACGVDDSEGMIVTAKKNAQLADEKNVELHKADSAALPWKNESFDVVTSRHAPFLPQEVARVLKPGGIFITQQVAENDKQNIKEIFGRGQCFGQTPGDMQRKLALELKGAGLEITKEDNYDATEWYKDMADVVFLLKNTPITEGLDEEKDRKHLEEVERKFKTTKGIKTNSARFIILAEKP